MTHNPTHIARLLLGSTLSEEEQEAVISMLPRFTQGQVGELVNVLENDKKEQAKLFAQAESKRDQVLLQMNVELGKIKIEEIEKKSWNLKLALYNGEC